VDIKSYIESGILESYVLGALSVGEEQEVLKMIVKYPALKEELVLIESGLEDFAMATAIPPAAGFEQLVYNKIFNSNAPASVVDNNTANPCKKAWNYTYALGTILLGSFIFGGYTYFNSNAQQQELDTIKKEQAVYAENYNEIKAQLEDLEDFVRVTKDKEFKHISLAGTDNAPDAASVVYWNPVTEEVFFTIQNLKSLAEDQQYQLWAIIDGAPVDAGVFSPGKKPIYRLKNIKGTPAAFAVTIEPSGGLESPTLVTMQVIGNVVAS